MRTLIAFMLCLCGWSVSGQGLIRNFFTTNPVPVVDVVAGTNATAQASTPTIQTRRFTVNGVTDTNVVSIIATNVAAYQASLATNGVAYLANNQTFTGSNTFNNAYVNGNGSGVTNLNASALASGTVPLSASVPGLVLAKTYLIAAGDSLTVGYYGAGSSWFDYLTNAVPWNGCALKTNLAVNGYTFDQVSNVVRSALSSYPLAGDTNGVMCVWDGANDYAYIGDLAAYCANISNLCFFVHSANYKACWFTIMSRTNYSEFGATGAGAKRTFVNNYIRRLYGFGMIDYLVDAERIFPSSLDLALFAPDGTHLERAGQTLLAAEVDEVLRLRKRWTPDRNENTWGDTYSLRQIDGTSIADWNTNSSQVYSALRIDGHLGVGKDPTAYGIDTLAGISTPYISSGTWYSTGSGVSFINTSSKYVLSLTEGTIPGVGINNNAPAASLDVGGDIRASTTITATNGFLYQGKPSFYTNFTCTTNLQVYCCNGTNQVITLPDARYVPWSIYRFACTNGWAKFILTNATGSQTIRDGASLSFTQIGIGSPSFISDGAHWWPAARTKVVFPAASWSCTTNIAMVNTASTSNYVTFNQLEFNNSQGIALENGQNFWITNSGEYLFTYSAVTKAGHNGDVISLWLKQNGVNIARTRTDCGAQTTSVIPQTVNFILNITTPSYINLVGRASGTGCTLDVGAAADSTMPACPSVIVTINRVSDPYP